MPFEDTIVRQSQAQRARLLRRTGELGDERPPARLQDTRDVSIRDHGLFEDHSGVTPTGFLNTGDFETNP
jgi:hypothetical protein